MSNKIALEALKSELRESAITMANLPTEFGVACLTDAGAQRIAKALTDAVAALEAMEAGGDTLADNVMYLLNQCPYAVRDYSGDRTGSRAKEDIAGSLAITFLGMQHRLAAIAKD